MGLPAKRECDPATIKLMVAHNSRLDSSHGWVTKELTLLQFEGLFLEHGEFERKDEAPAFVPGSIHGDRRQKHAISQLDWLIIDLDKGEDINAVIAAVKARRLYALIHSTYSHHAPLPKYRLVFPLAKPFSRQDHFNAGGTQKSFEALWKAKYAAFADSLGLEWDRSCTDISRAFYWPSCMPGAERMATRIEGQLLDLDAIEVQLEQPGGCKSAASEPEHTNLTFQGFDLKAWAGQYGTTFQIEDALRSSSNLPSDFFRTERDEGGVHIECPFEGEHTEPGGTGTYVVNASENSDHGFSIFCSHPSCKARRGNGVRVDRLLFLKKMLENGWLKLDDLSNPEFGGDQYRLGPNDENRRATSREDLRVIDKHGKGIDVAIFHSSMIAKPGLFDFARLNSLCGTQIEPDVTAEQLAGFIECRQVTVADLVACGTPQGSDEADAYTQKLKNVANEQAAGKLLKRQVDDELRFIAKEFDVRWKSIETDFKRFQKETSSPILHSHFGILSAEDAALIKPLRNYVRDFAILNTGGKAVIMNLKQPDLSKAIMAESDFELLHRNEWIEVVREEGHFNTILPAKQFITKPPKNTRVYRGGFVFKPSGTVAADQYNLYRGMLIEPDPSGSCSMFHELIKDVWAHGEETTADWVLEWLMHIVAYPGHKVGTSLAIRGGYGEGKTIVPDLMSTILGDLLLSVTNHRMILGDFNRGHAGQASYRF